MKKFVFIFVLVLTVNIFSQNKQVLYDFGGLPQTLLLNPGLETNLKFHVGLPFLSGFSLEIGSTGFSAADIFAADGRNINEKIRDVLATIDASDNLKVHSQIEIFSAGYRLNEKTYISAGFYQELDAIGYLPKDILTLASEGNAAYLNRSFSLSQVLYKVDVLGVLHAGITKEVNKKLTVGGRFKIYSSALNLESTNNAGTLTTALGTNNVYMQYLNNVNLEFRSAGLIKNKKYIDAPNTYISNIFLGGNMGVGLDFGITSHISPQLQFSGSIIDVGFVNYKKDIKNTLTTGSFTFEGIEFELDEPNRDYWNELETAFKEQVFTTDNQDSYVSWRPIKFNAALKYSFGKKRSKYCYDNTYKEFYTDAFGAQLYTVVRPLKQQFAGTGFYEKSFSNKLHAKVTYTVDDYSYYNLGVGISAQIWKINFYGIVDNIAELSDISGSNNLSLQFGFNLLFN
ncbi:MAG: hypothetical protein ACJA17_000058 [Polaribacter sp.]|jgi:hypothetical protein